MSEFKTVKNFITFKDKPLVQNGSIMIYGSMSESAYADMVVLSTKNEKNEEGAVVEVADTIMVTIMSTEKNPDGTPAKKEPLRSQEFKNGLYQALDYAYEQIERFNKLIASR